MTFAEKYDLLPGDVVITPKSSINIVEHYVVFWGRNEFGEEFYLENNQYVGVRWITGTQFAAENPTFKRIRRFNGNDNARYWAIERAKALLGNKYHLTEFNCEHYANHVQYGTAKSDQADNGKQLGLVASLFLLAAIIVSA